MKWIKYYTNASDSDGLEDLMDRGGPAAYGRFWMLVGFLAREWDGVTEPTFAYHLKTITRTLRYHRVLDSVTFLRSLELSRLSTSDIDGDVVTISMPKLLKYCHKDAVSSGLRPATGTPETGLDIDKSRLDKNINTSTALSEKPKSKKKTSPKGAIEVFQGTKIESLLVTVGADTQQRWLKSLDAEFIISEGIKADIWLASQPTEKKDISRFFGNWLVRASSPKPKYVSGGKGPRPVDSILEATEKNPTGNPYKAQLDQASGDCE